MKSIRAKKRESVSQKGVKDMAKRRKTPTIIQMEAVECGAASLGIILGYYQKHIPLEELRVACGVSRDGSKAINIVKAAREYGLISKGYRKEPADLKEMKLPVIIHWNFNHFIVVEGFKKDKVYINDPATGPRVISESEFDRSFTGIVLSFEPGEDFKKEKRKTSLWSSLRSRVTHMKTALIYVILISFMLVLPGLVIPIFTQIFVDDILIGGMNNWFIPLLIGLAITALLRGGLTWLQQYYLLKMETALALSMASKYFWHVLRLPIEFFLQRNSGDITERVNSNDRVASLLSGQLSTNFLNCIMVVFYLVIMVQFSIVLTLVVVFFALINIVFLNRVSRVRVDQNMKLLQVQGKMSGTSMAGLQMIETLKANGRESDFFTKWSGHQANAMNTQQKLGVFSQTLNAIPSFLTMLSNIVILGLGGWLVLSGELTIGMLVAFQSLMQSFMTPVNSLVQLGSQLQEVKGDLNRLDDVLKYKVDSITEYDDTHGDDDSKSKLTGKIELKNVTFGYSRLESPLIENFHLSVKPGSRVALVGGSGSGKSTMAKLITGLYKPWEGEILFDGRPREKWNHHLVTNSISVVDQDINMFEGTIRDNLTLWDATVPEIDVIRAAKDSVIHDDIVSKNNDYNYIIEEGARNFSGGQKQRLEIARALVNNPSILILDEATSALDPRTELLIDRNLRRRGCTCLIIAHRLSTIRDCDEIILLDKGRVIQRGTHDDMIEEDGPYANLIGQA